MIEGIEIGHGLDRNFGLPDPKQGLEQIAQPRLLRSDEHAIGGDGARCFGRRDKDRVQSFVRGGRQILPHAEKLAQVLPIPRCFVDRDRGDGADIEGEGGGYAEVATSAPARSPKEVGVVVFVGLYHPGTLIAGGDHHFDAKQVIAGQTHASGEQADTPAQ